MYQMDHWRVEAVEKEKLEQIRKKLNKYLMAELINLPHFEIDDHVSGLRNLNSRQVLLISYEMLSVLEHQLKCVVSELLFFCFALLFLYAEI